jgi:hypothetical protein
MSIRTISITDLATVVGGGTGATSELQAVKNYLLDNGNGSWFSQAAGLGSKLAHRAGYSFGFMNYQPYADYTAAAPGGKNYIEDLERLRPGKR